MSLLEMRDKQIAESIAMLAESEDFTPGQRDVLRRELMKAWSTGRAVGEGIQPRVTCDLNCGAFIEPVSLADHIAALQHWRSHQSLGGCSHQR